MASKLSLLISAAAASVAAGAAMIGLGSSLGNAAVDGAIFGLAVFACTASLEGPLLVPKVALALFAATALGQLAAYAAAVAIDRGSDHPSSWWAPVLFASLLILTPWVHRRMGLRRRSRGGGSRPS